MEEIKKDNQVIYNFFSQHPLFKHSVKNKKKITKLIGGVSLFRYTKSEYLYKHGEKPSYVYLVQDGEIQIIARIENTQEKIIAIQRHGALFGEASSLSNQAHTSDAQASLDSYVFLIPSKLFKELLETEASIASHIAQLLSSRLHQNLRKETQGELEKVFVLLYPELPERGYHLSKRITQALIRESSGAILLITTNQYGDSEKKESYTTLTEILKRNMKYSTEQLEKSRLLGKYSVILAEEIYNNDINQDAIAKEIPALLGHLRQHYSRIFIDAGHRFENPIIKSIFSQCDHIILTKNANSSDTQKWHRAVSYATNCIENFFDRVVVISDNCTARGGHSARTINTYSALYKNHHYLHTSTAVSLATNQEKEFVRGLHRIVRKLSGTSRGLALGGGGARAIAHIGVFEVLEQEGIDFDAVAGASMGSVVGAIYAMGKDTRSMIGMLGRILPSSKMILDKTFPIVSFFRGHRLNRSLLKAFSRIRFEDLEIAFYCTSSDLVSGQVIIFEKGYISTAIRASVGVPVAFPPIELGSYRLVDGGVLNNMPGNILKNKGFHKIIGINVSNIHDNDSTLLHLKDHKGSIWKKMRDYFSIPPIINIANRAIEIQGNALMRIHEKDFDYILYPDVKDFKLFDFSQADAIIDKGREATLKSLDQIKATLYTTDI